MRVPSHFNWPLPTDAFIFLKGEAGVSTSVQAATECFIKRDSLAQFLPPGVHVANCTAGLIDKTRYLLYI